MKWYRFVTTIALSLVALSLSAVAQKPTITEIPFFPAVIPAGPGGCTFDVSVTQQAGRPSMEREIDFANGTKSLIVGPLFATLTNLSTGKSINVNISGPVVFTFTGPAPDGLPITFRFLGQGLLAQFPPDLISAAGLPSVALTSGQLVLGFDAQGNPSSLSFHGTAQDVCQMLQ